MIVQRPTNRVLVFGQPMMVFSTGRTTAAPAWTPADPTTDGGVSAEHWYRADSGTWQDAGVTPADGDGEVVGRWEDLTDNADHVNQATADNKPILKVNILNGEPILRFDGSNDLLQGAFANGGEMTQPVTIFAVAQLDASVVNDNLVNRCLLTGDDIDHHMTLYTDKAQTPDKWRIYAGGGPLTGTADDGDWNIWTILFNGASSQFWQNGISEAAGDAGAQNPDGLTVGANWNSTDFWYGDFAEIILFDANLSDADKNQLGQYLADRYGLGYTDI